MRQVKLEWKGVEGKRHRASIEPVLRKAQCYRVGKNVFDVINFSEIEGMYEGKVAADMAWSNTLYYQDRKGKICKK